MYEQLKGIYHKGEDGMRYPDLCRSKRSPPTSVSMVACTLHPSRNTVPPSRLRQQNYANLLTAGWLSHPGIFGCYFG